MVRPVAADSLLHTEDLAGRLSSACDLQRLLLDKETEEEVGTPGWHINASALHETLVSLEMECLAMVAASDPNASLLLGGLVKIEESTFSKAARAVVGVARTRAAFHFQPAGPSVFEEKALLLRAQLPSYGHANALVAVVFQRSSQAEETAGGGGGGGGGGGMPALTKALVAVAAAFTAVAVWGGGDGDGDGDGGPVDMEVVRICHFFEQGKKLSRVEVLRDQQLQLRFRRVLEKHGAAAQAAALAKREAEVEVLGEQLARQAGPGLEKPNHGGELIVDRAKLRAISEACDLGRPRRMERAAAIIQRMVRGVPKRTDQAQTKVRVLGAAVRNTMDSRWDSGTLCVICPPAPPSPPPPPILCPPPLMATAADPTFIPSALGTTPLGRCGRAPPASTPRSHATSTTSPAADGVEHQAARRRPRR